MTETGLISVFLIIGGLGFLFLMISLIVGDLFDAFQIDLDLDTNGDFGLFDSRVVSVFLTALGFVGAISVWFGFSALVAGLFGVATGIALGAFVFAFGYLLHKQQASSSVSDRDLIGRTAQVTVGIKPGGIGQISCLIGDERVEKIARSKYDEEIEAGKTVFIEEVSSEAIIVTLFDDFRETNSLTA